MLRPSHHFCPGRCFWARSPWSRGTDSAFLFQRLLKLKQLRSLSLKFLFHCSHQLSLFRLSRRRCCCFLRLFYFSFSFSSVSKTTEFQTTSLRICSEKFKVDDSHYSTYTFPFRKVGRMYFLYLGVKGLKWMMISEQIWKQQCCQFSHFLVETKLRSSENHYDL